MWVAQMTAANDTLQRCDSLSMFAVLEICGWETCSSCTNMLLQLDLHVSKLENQHCCDALAAVLNLLGTTICMGTFWLACESGHCGCIGWAC